MIKRFTLLKRRDGMSEADFRAHWAEPHAEIAKGFSGLCRYHQNRVDGVLWQTGTHRFDVQGIVELWFASEDDVRQNATSDTTRALIKDEPRFLSGLTALMAGSQPFCDPEDTDAQKVMILAVCDRPDALAKAVSGLVTSQASGLAIEPLTLGFTRETLGSEPVPPTLAVTLWLPLGHDLMAPDGPLCAAFDRLTTGAMAYAIDALHIV